MPQMGKLEKTGETNKQNSQQISRGKPHWYDVACAKDTESSGNTQSGQPWDLDSGNCFGVNRSYFTGRQGERGLGQGSERRQKGTAADGGAAGVRGSWAGRQRARGAGGELAA